MSGNSEAPALERGLDILETVAKHGSMPYKEILNELDIPPASAARLLKCLVRKGYLSKTSDTGAYLLGESVGKLVQPMEPSAALREAGEPVLRQLQDSLNQTVVLFHWTGIAWECIAKKNHEDSITMQRVGEVRVDIFNYPWGVFAYEQLARENRQLMLNVNEKRLSDSLEAFKANGYAIVRGGAFSRLAVPLRDGDGRLLGALAAGVMRSVLEELTEHVIADLLIAGASKIEARLQNTK